MIYAHNTKQGGRLCDSSGAVQSEWGGDCLGQDEEEVPAVLLSVKLGDHLGVRVSKRGGMVDVYFVCDGDAARNATSRVKHMFSQVGCGCVGVGAVSP